ncbi:amidohydrolase family protein [Amycolatopsis sp. lyj-90]|uniref:amidohydrolase family protein n=1 Tax=Amycolatopsis sp. lyj-90 TaxID=2789285 RepID=UPI00397B8103
MNRRRLLGSVGVLGAVGKLAGAGRAAAQDTVAEPTGAWRIDTHHHAIAPEMQNWLVRNGILPPDQDKWPTWARWSAEETLNIMDANGIAAGVMSAPAPFEIFGSPRQVAEAARICNASLAEVVKENPGRFGFFAYLPLTSVEDSIGEIEYSLDTLGADGVLLMTHVDGRYLGDPGYEPIFAELARRRAVCFIHPQFIPGGSPQGIPDFMGDFLLDTTRSAIRLMLSGTLDRYPDLPIILSHGGGFLPYMAGRIDSRTHSEEGVEPATLRRHVRRFYYDTATPTSPYATPSLLAAADPARLLFGTDWNMRTAEEVRQVVDGHVRDPALDSRARRRIGRDNALRLLPSLSERVARVA